MKLAFCILCMCSLVVTHRIQAAAPADWPFPPLTIDEARTRAQSERKPLLLFFDGYWSEDAAKVRKTTLQDREVTALIGQNTIAVYVDVLREPALVARWKIAKVPQLILLPASEVSAAKRWYGHIPAKDFARMLAPLFPKESLEIERQRLKPHDSLSQLALGDGLFAAGRDEEALRQYLWLRNTGLSLADSKKIRTPVKREEVLARFKRLAHLASAREAINSIAEDLERAIQNEPDNSRYLGRLVALLLDFDNRRLLAIGDELPLHSTSQVVFEKYYRARLEGRIARSTEASASSSDQPSVDDE